MPIIIRYMGLRTWGGGLKRRKWVRNLKFPFQVILLFKHYKFWSIGRYQSSFINLTENSQVLILKFTQWPSNVYWRISIFREMKFWFVFPKKAMSVADLSNFSLKKSQRDISPQLIFWYWVSIDQTKLFEVMIVL